MQLNMSRRFSLQSLGILKYLDQNEVSMFHELKRAHIKAKSQKTFYNAVYRLQAAKLITISRSGYTLTPEGAKVIHKFFPKRDGIWKIVIFDIPERKRRVRTFLRGRLKHLNFQRWQNSTWISPYALDREIEEELKQLAERYFIRLIKTTK